MVIIALTALLGMLALTADMATLHLARQQLQNAADVAALAGAAELRHSADAAVVAAEAVAMANANVVLGQQVELKPDDVQIGYEANDGTWIAGWPEMGLPSVRVTARRTASSAGGPVKMTFARLFGIENVDVSASATAQVSGGQIGRAPVEIAITQDVSHSFAEELETAKLADRDLVSIVHDCYMPGDTLGVVRFRGSANRPLGLTSAGADANVVHSAIDAITLGSDLASGTNTASGLQNATDMLLTQAAPDTDRIIVLVSDGMPSGRTTSETEQLRQDAIDAADAAAAAGITIHAVTFIQDGSDGDAEFNASLARNGGFAFHTPEPEDLAGILQTVGHVEVGHPILVE